MNSLQNTLIHNMIQKNVTSSADVNNFLTDVLATLEAINDVLSQLFQSTPMICPWNTILWIVPPLSAILHKTLSLFPSRLSVV